FTLGTVICAAAPAFPILLIGRFIQAIGTGMLLPIIFNVFLLIYPPFKRGKIMGIVGFVIMFAPTIGPTLSGVIVEYLGWRSLFIMVIPFSIFSIAFASKFLINVSEVTKPKIDYLSLVFSTIGFGAVIYGFSSAGKSESGFLSINVLIPIIVGIIGIVLFSIRQLNLKEPLIDLRVFKYPMYTHAILMF
ncbi:MFS transporter, partial [Staphylococcus argenteus]|nr:MFS transporter [Staphylococcus argenteus]